MSEDQCPVCNGSVIWNGQCWHCHPPKGIYTVDVICAWCNPPRKVGTKSGMTEDSPTHTICDACQALLLGNPEPIQGNQRRKV